MAFWTDKTLEPKRKYRFLVRFGGFDGGLTFVAKKATKPKMSVSKAEHKYINHTFKYPGRVEWNDVEITIVDPTNPDAAKGLASILESSGYIIPRTPNDVTTMSKASAVSMLGSITIEQWGDNHPTNFGSEGLPESADGKLETWRLKNAWISDVDFGDLDYESDDLSEIKIVITYDWAELESAPGANSGHSDADDVIGSLGLEANTRWKLN